MVDRLLGSLHKAWGGLPTWLSRLLKVGGLLLFLGWLGLGMTLAVLWPRCSGDGCPSVEALREYTPPQASRVFDKDGKLLAHLAPERRVVVPLEKIPLHVRQAFLAVEDRRFYGHPGVDVWRVVGALVQDVLSLRYEQGFSTVTMQLARNVFPEHLTREKTLRRKVWEVVLAWDIERSFSKDQILELYLNQIYLGEGCFGVEAASQEYFGKSVAQLSLPEAALLAALPKAPSYYSPRQNPEEALQRRNLVLSLMEAQGVASAESSANARSEQVRLIPPLAARGEAPYFIAAIQKELLERFGPGVETSGLRVFTGLDLHLQHSAEKQLVQQIESIEKGELGRFRHTRCAGGQVTDADACLQGMYVAMDPRTGDVLALVGGRDYALSQFDRVTQGRRQAGSAFKPIVYAAAIAAGIPVSLQLVGPGVGIGGAWGANFDLGGYQPEDHVSEWATLDLRSGLSTSSNRAAVVLGEKVGLSHVVEMGRLLGITTRIPRFPSTFLGAPVVVPLELVAAYAPFTNGGLAVTPRLIRRVEDVHGKVLWEASDERRPVLSPSVAWLTLSLMGDVVTRGTGRGARVDGLSMFLPMAGKTGTTNGWADAWFIGVTPDLVAGVWLGFDKPQRIVREGSGGRLAAPVWGRIAAKYYEGREAPAAWLPPEELVMRDIDGTSGYLANGECPEENVRTEWFIPGTEPVDHCPDHGGVGEWLRRTFEGFGGLFGGGSAQARE